MLLWRPKVWGISKRVALSHPIVTCTGQCTGMVLFSQWHSLSPGMAILPAPCRVVNALAFHRLQLNTVLQELSELRGTPLEQLQHATRKLVERLGVSLVRWVSSKGWDIHVPPLSLSSLPILDMLCEASNNDACLFFSSVPACCVKVESLLTENQTGLIAINSLPLGRLLII